MFKIFKKRVVPLPHPKLPIAKRAKFTSLLFIAVSIFIGSAIIWAADMYYDIDAQKVVINEVQRVVKSGTTALEILGIAKFGDGGAADYAQFSQTGDLGFFGAADTVSKSDGAFTIQTAGQNLNLQTTGSGTLLVSSAGALNFSANATSTWNLGANTLAVSSQNFNVSADGNITAQAGYGLDTIAAGALNLGNTAATSVNIGNTAATSLGMGAGGSLARTINIGTGTGADTINIGTGLTGADIIAIGGGSGTLAINTGDWGISTTGAMTGISGITTNGGYTQTGSGANTFSGAASFTADNTGLAVTNNATVGGTLGVTGLTTLGGNLTFSGTAARTITGPATGGMTLAVAGGPIDLTTTGSGAITLNSAGQLILQFGAAGGFTLGDGATNYFQIAADGTLTLATGAGDEIVLNPAGVAAGVVRLGPGDVILTDGGGAAMRTSGEEIMRGMAPIFGFDMPARTASTDYIAVSRELEDYPFPAAMTGTTRVHKFVIRYADTVNTQTTWRVYNTTDGAAAATFTVPASASSNLEKGEVYTTDAVTVPVDTDDWRLDVRVADGSGGTIQIYQIFLAAYDRVN